MSVSAEYLFPAFNSPVGRSGTSDVSHDSRTTESFEADSHQARWAHAAFGVGVLYLFLVGMLFWSPVWLTSRSRPPRHE